jgi:hypothetical protein
LYTAQVNFVRADDRNRGTGEAAAYRRFKVRGDAMVADIVDVAVEQLASFDEPLAIRDITLRPLWWNTQAVENCEPEPIGR